MEKYIFYRIHRYFGNEINLYECKKCGYQGRLKEVQYHTNNEKDPLRKFILVKKCK